MREFRLRIGKVLVALAFALFFIGFTFSINSNMSNGAKLIYSSNIVKNSDTNINIHDVDNSSVSASNYYNNNSMERVVYSDSIDDSISLIKSNIKNKYNITVLGGNEINNYTVGGMATYNISDRSELLDNLYKLESVLEKYPSGMFSEINRSGMNLYVYLIDSYSSKTVTGITERLKTKYIISIACCYPFEDSFNHEMYHYMEYFINNKGGAYSNWNNYNPNGFTYGSVYEMYSYDKTLSPNSYFVNSYAQSYEYEDRASTFEYMMADSKISPLNFGNNIWLKGKVISETLDYYFDSVDSNTMEYWERFIY